MPCARCSICGLNFPVEYMGTECPVCQTEQLAGIENDVPDPAEDLERAVNQAEFDRYYEETRGISADA